MEMEYPVFAAFAEAHLKERQKVAKEIQKAFGVKGKR